MVLLRLRNGFFSANVTVSVEKVEIVEVIGVVVAVGRDRFRWVFPLVAN